MIPLWKVFVGTKFQTCDLPSWYYIPLAIIFILLLFSSSKSFYHCMSFTLIINFFVVVLSPFFPQSFSLYSFHSLGSLSLSYLYPVNPFFVFLPFSSILLPLSHRRFPQPAFSFHYLWMNGKTKYVWFLLSVSFSTRI